MSKANPHTIIHMNLLSRNPGSAPDYVYCFIAACSVPLNLPDLSDTVSCSVSKTCTGVTCCVYSEEVGRNFQVSVEIDSCARTITVELEQVKFEIPFEEYLWGRSTLIGPGHEKTCLQVFRPSKTQTSLLS